MTQMDEQTRYRATGTLFLIAVAIICLPMLLDGDGVERLKLAPLNVPQSVPAVASLSEIAPESDLPERVAELAEQVDEGGFYTDSGARVGEPVLTTPDEATRIWAVQVASFREPARARKLRDDLRQEGYEAFLSTARRDDEILHRVAVGPLLNAADAEALVSTLTLVVEQPARLMAFSN